MAKTRIIIPVALVILVCGLLYFRPWSGSNGSADQLPFSGNIELTEADIGLKSPGRLVALTVDEGDFVSEGALLARSDDEQLLQLKAEIQAQLEGIVSQGRELEKLIAFQEANLAAQLEQRKAEIRQAQALLDQLEEGSRVQDKDRAHAAVAIAEAEFGRADSDWQRAQELFRNEDISKAAFDQYRSSYLRAEGALRQAREQLSLVEEGPRSQEIESARAGVERARAALKQTEATSLDIERNRQSQKTLDAQTSGLEARLGQVEKQLSDTRAYAPFDGVILVKSAEIGEVVAAGTAIVSVGDLAHPWVRGYIPETALGRVKLGQEVSVRTDSYPGKTYTGRVSFISSEAEFTPKQIETRQERVKLVYRIKVDIDNPNQEFKLNMPVDAVIQLGNRGAQQ
jgi:HlyD family secretion protein